MNKCIHGIPVYFDCDDTLVLWGLEDHPEAIPIDDGTMQIKVVPHKQHIQMMKRHKARGHKIVIWSAGGSEWAEKVAKAIDVYEIADLIISKPVWFYDDIQGREILPDHNRIYLYHEGSSERLKSAQTKYGVIKEDGLDS